MNINISEIVVKSSDFVYTCSLCQRQQQVAQAAAVPATGRAIGPLWVNFYFARGGEGKRKNGKPRAHADHALVLLKS